MKTNMLTIASVVALFSFGCTTVPSGGYAYDSFYSINPSSHANNAIIESLDAEIAEGNGAEEKPQSDKYFIWSGSISLEHKDVAVCEEEVINAVKALSGTIKAKRNYEDSCVSIDFLVPNTNFDKCMDDIKQCGTLLSERVFSEDVTANYVDVQSRLDNLIKTRDKYKALLDKAQTVEEILKVERELSRVQSEIDAKQAVFNALKNDVTQYEINVVINKKKIKGPLGYLFSGIEYVVVKLFIWN